MKSSGKGSGYSQLVGTVFVLVIIASAGKVETLIDRRTIDVNGGTLVARNYHLSMADPCSIVDVHVVQEHEPEIVTFVSHRGARWRILGV